MAGKKSARQPESEFGTSVELMNATSNERTPRPVRATETSTKRPAIKQSNNVRRDHYISTHGSVGFVVREVWRLYARCLQPRIAREGVSIGMWFVLRMFWGEEGMTQSELR